MLKTLPLAETTPASIEVRGATVAYPNGNRALENVNFTLGPGTICGLVGVNGSGKSTLFKTIMGFLKPATGEVRINGLPVHDALRRNIVAYVPQSEESTGIIPCWSKMS